MMDPEFAVGLSRFAFLGGAILILILVMLLGVVFLAAKYATLKMDHEELQEKVNELNHEIEKMQWEKEYVSTRKSKEDAKDEVK